MPTIIRKTITFTEKQDKWIKSQISAGKFTNDSEYLRDLVRRDQAQKEQFFALKAAITEGMDSGISDKSVPDIMKEVEERMKVDGRL
ncbi:type II toxin-antitoxin system ParD family antitoxin [Aquimarina rhabdastrellae]